MQSYQIPLWKTSPFCRIIIPFIIGISMQWYVPCSIDFILQCLCCFLLSFILFYFLPVETRFRFRSFQGMILMLLLIVFAMFISWKKDIRHDQNWYGHSFNQTQFFIVRIAEPVTEKAKSYKATAVVEAAVNREKTILCDGKLFIYFSKDSAVARLQYGDRILIKNNLQRIKKSGNPGAFDYERYGCFQQVFYTSYLKGSDWVKLPSKDVNPVYHFIFSLQENIIHILKENIAFDKNVLGIAEALLIGYKEDLDKDLVQAYSNTGVVHIIAISGLHLGLIYIMLIWLFDRIPWVKKQKIIKVILVLACLWLFSLLTGASASVLRSAVMFTCVLIGKSFFKQADIYNSLAASAFILLAYDPYFLWDVGFQLSYLAIIGIVSFQKPIMNLLYFKTGWLNKTWSMLAVTIAAQVLTFPVCIYYFHQFPNLFFITNLVAVPLSTIILFAEIFLIAFSWLPLIGPLLGKLIGWMVWLMNLIIQQCNNLPFAVMDNIYANPYTTWLLYFFIISISVWLIHKNKYYRNLAIVSFLSFIALQSYVKLRLNDQQKIIIYNVPKQQAIDFIQRNHFFFQGDSVMKIDGAPRNFHLKPARISLQATKELTDLPGLFHKNNEWQFSGKKLIIIDSAIHFLPSEIKVITDILLISKNPSVRIADLVTVIKPSIIVFDASNSLWKIAGWKKECLALDLPCFSIPEQGAFILDIE